MITEKEFLDLLKYTKIYILMFLITQMRREKLIIKSKLKNV